MDEIKKDNTKLANQAWRKKPRKFAPKSRLGCKTCKIRRIKCDLSQPSCLKCQSTGRTCDGYGTMPLASKTETESSHYNDKANNAGSYDIYHPCTTISAYQPTQWHAKHHGLILQNLGPPFMILPVTGSVQTEAMSFFEYTSIKHLNGYHHCESWRNTLMFFSQTVPSVRHAAIALALIHRNYLDGDYSDRAHQKQSLRGWVTDKVPLLHYNRAIHFLLNQEIYDSTEITAITLLVCYLFTCFDHLAGNYVQAMKHLRAGVELSRNIDNKYDNVKPLGIGALINQVTRRIRRLDMQAVMFLIDWTPANIQETCFSQFPAFNNAFQTLDQAADHLQILVSRVMRLRNTEQQLSPMGRMPPLPSSLKDIVLGQMDTWLHLFENMLQQGSSYETDSDTYPLILLLRLQHTTAWIFLSSYGPGREMEYDKFLPQFQQCMALAGDIAAMHERFSGSIKPTFTPEIGIVPVLYIIGVKCRHPVIRRNVLEILRRQTIQEAVWDSISAARVIEWVINIEEGGSEERKPIHTMEQIALWQRIEALSWVRIVSGQSAARLDITYTFCAREGLHIESLND